VVRAARPPSRMVTGARGQPATTKPVTAHAVTGFASFCRLPCSCIVHVHGVVRRLTPAGVRAGPRLPPMRAIVANDADSSVGSLLDRPGTSRIRVLRHQGDNAPRGISLAELRLANGDDVTASRADGKQDLSLDPPSDCFSNSHRPCPGPPFAPPRPLALFSAGSRLSCLQPIDSQLTSRPEQRTITGGVI
jgi:hypothetical protein